MAPTVALLSSREGLAHPSLVQTNNQLPGFPRQLVGYGHGEEFAV